MRTIIKFNRKWRIIHYVLVSILLFSCRENKAQKQKESNSETNYSISNIESDKSVNSSKEEINLNETIIKWKLIDVTRFFEKSVEQSDYKRFIGDEIYFKDNKMFFNSTNATFTLDNMDFIKMLGKGSSYQYVTEYLKKKYKINISEKYFFLNINKNETNVSVFSQFDFTTQGGRVYHTPLFIENYLFLYTKDDYFLTYETEKLKNLGDIYKKLPSTSLPLNNNSNFIDDENFKPISNLYSNILGIRYLNDYNGIKLPNLNQDIKVILVSAYQESGEVNMYLYTLSQDYKIIEKFDLSYIEGETDSGKNIGREVNSISQNYTIKVTDYLENAKELEKMYKINDSGKFIEQK